MTIRFEIPPKMLPTRLVSATAARSELSSSETEKEHYLINKTYPYIRPSITELSFKYHRCRNDS